MAPDISHKMREGMAYKKNNMPNYLLTFLLDLHTNTGTADAAGAFPSIHA